MKMLIEKRWTCLLNKMRLDTTFAKRNCSSKDKLNMWTQTCNQEYKPEYTLRIPERGVETTDKQCRKQTTEEEQFRRRKRRVKLGFSTSLYI